MDLASAAMLIPGKAKAGAVGAARGLGNDAAVVDGIGLLASADGTLGAAFSGDNKLSLSVDEAEKLGVGLTGGRANKSALSAGCSTTCLHNLIWLS